LVTTGSATKTGVVAMCELIPFVVVTALGGRSSIGSGRAG
jgi:hypothetical protein